MSPAHNRSSYRRALSSRGARAGRRHLGDTCRGKPTRVCGVRASGARSWTSARSWSRRGRLFVVTFISVQPYQPPSRTSGDRQAVARSSRWNHEADRSPLGRPDSAAVAEARVLHEEIPVLRPGSATSCALRAVARPGRRVRGQHGRCRGRLTTLFTRGMAQGRRRRPSRCLRAADHGRRDSHRARRGRVGRGVPLARR